MRIIDKPRSKAVTRSNVHRNGRGNLGAVHQDGLWDESAFIEPDLPEAEDNRQDGTKNEKEDDSPV
jgi:hypothetical protein